MIRVKTVTLGEKEFDESADDCASGSPIVHVARNSAGAPRGSVRVELYFIVLPVCSKTFAVQYGR